MNKKDKFEKTITINTSSVWIGWFHVCAFACSHERFVNLPDDGSIVLDGTEIGIVHRTFYGDGSYPASKRRDYWVDSGNLSIIDRKFVNGDFQDGGSFFTIKEGTHTITLVYENGTFTFKVDGKEIEHVETRC